MNEWTEHGCERRSGIKNNPEIKEIVNARSAYMR